jgi:hypothetical protein
MRRSAGISLTEINQVLKTCSTIAAGDPMSLTGAQLPSGNQVAMSPFGRKADINFCRLDGEF